MTKTRTKYLCEWEFVFCMLAVQKRRGHTHFNTRERISDGSIAFHLSMAEAYQQLRTILDGTRVQVAFSIMVHPIHGDSPTLWGTFGPLALDHSIRYEPPRFTILLDEADIVNVFKWSAVEETVYEELAVNFNQLYYRPAAERPFLQEFLQRRAASHQP